MESQPQNPEFRINPETLDQIQLCLLSEWLTQVMFRRAL